MKKYLSVFFAALLMLQPIVCSASPKIVKEDESIVTAAVPEGKAKSPEGEEVPVALSAKSVALMEVSTGKVLLEYNPDEKLYPASVTKIMTLLLVMEAVDSGKIALTDKVACSANASSKGGSQIWLKEGETMTVDELLRATAIGSANDAATLLGEYVSGSEEAFVAQMNKRAKELGMKNTNFSNATGLDDTTTEHLTTARDIGIMSCELMKHDRITKYTTVWMDSLRSGATELVNTNKLVRFYSGTTGLKTGTTSKAGCCVSATAKRDGLHLVAVVMGSPNSKERFDTAKNMLNWGFSNFVIVSPKFDESLLKNVPVLGGTAKNIAPAKPTIKPVLVKKGEEDKIKQTVTLSENVEAPVENGQKLGTLTLTLNGKTIAEYELTSSQAVDKLTFMKSLRGFLSFLASGKAQSC